MELHVASFISKLLGGAKDQTKTPQGGLAPRPRVSAAYIERLLSEEGGNGGVRQVADYWSGRVQEAHPQFGLSRPEYMVELTLNYFGDVGSSGHAQHFQTWGRERAEDTLVALRELSLEAAADLFQKALTKVKGLDVQCDENWDHITSLTLELDNPIWEMSLDVDDPIRIYLQSNLDFVLRAERGLPPLADEKGCAAK